MSTHKASFSTHTVLGHGLAVAVCAVVHARALRKSKLYFIGLE